MNLSFLPPATASTSKNAGDPDFAAHAGKFFRNNWPDWLVAKIKTQRRQTRIRLAKDDQRKQ